ncbi:MAG: hypothetical protein BZ133_06495 [Methanosphaera sp. SHI613]|nr:MAG: hypothetical protein BZ133_06495 [Methanosphaera sp. SHI613]
MKNILIIMYKLSNMDYIYIDESGDLGNKGSKFFVMAGIKVNNPRLLERMITKTRRTYKKEIGKSNEIKGTTTPSKVKKSILKRLNKIDAKIFIIIFNKKNKYKIDYNYDNHRLYDILSSELIKLIKINTTTEILIDRTKTNKEKIKNLNSTLIENIQNPLKHKITIKQVDSLKYKGVQIADIISWSTFQHVENNNKEYLKIIENTIIKQIYED